MDHRCDIVTIAGKDAIEQHLIADVAIDVAIGLDFEFETLPAPRGARLVAKKTRRISLSMPTTSNPCAAKKRTDSAPINPADPVTSTTLKPQPPPARYRSTGSSSARWRASHSRISSRIVSTERVGVHPVALQTNELSEM